MLLYLYAIQALAFGVTHLVNSRHLAAALTGVCCLCLSLASGFTIHFEEVGVWASWLRYASPQWWMQHPLLQDELNPVNTFRCSRNPVTTEKSIILKIQCGLPSGQAALKYFDFLPFSSPSPFTNSANFDPSNLYDSLMYGLPFIATVIFYAVFSFIGFAVFLCVKQTTKRSRSKLNKM